MSLNNLIQNTNEENTLEEITVFEEQKKEIIANLLLIKELIEKMFNKNIELDINIIEIFYNNLIKISKIFTSENLDDLSYKNDKLVPTNFLIEEIILLIEKNDNKLSISNYDYSKIISSLQLFFLYISVECLENYYNKVKEDVKNNTVGILEHWGCNV